MMPAFDNDNLRGELRYDEPLSRHTSWRIGGPARRFYRPADRADLLTFLRRLEPREPLFWLGLGSNLLVRDGGFPGTVIATQGRLNHMDWKGPDRLYAEAGVACARIARAAAARQHDHLVVHDPRAGRTPVVERGAGLGQAGVGRGPLAAATATPATAISDSPPASWPPVSPPSSGATRSTR